MDSFTTKVLTILNNHIEEKYRGNVSAAQEGLGLAPDKSVFHRWIKALAGDEKQGRIPRLDSIGAIMDKLGVQALTPAERAELRLAQKEADAAAPTSADNKKIRELEERIAELMQYKYKWEAALELSGKKPEAAQKKGNIA